MNTSLSQLIIILVIGAFSSCLTGQQLHFKDKDLPCINKHFNLHVHIVLDEFGQTNIDTRDIQKAIDTANVHFSPICFSFSICEIDTITNYAFNITEFDDEPNALRENHYHKNRLNLFLVDLLLLGGAPVCGLGGGQNVIMAKNCTGITLTHELGHVFSLAHTFGGTPELVDGSNCETAGDGICDTPADPYSDPRIRYVDDCEFIWLGEDANRQVYQPDVGNIMSYYSCRCGFTKGQYLQMVDFYLNSPLVKW